MNLTRRFLLALVALSLLVLGSGCSDRDPTDLEIARAPINPIVFQDNLLGFPGEQEGDIYFQPFSSTYTEAVTIDGDYTHTGVGSMKVTVPAQGSGLGDYSGGVLTSVGARDFADFNALTFYARSSINSSLDEAGFGNDNTGTSLFTAGRSGISLNTGWTFVVIPIPDSSKLIAERGMFTFAERYENFNPMGHEIWFDEIKFANLGNITDPRPKMATVVQKYFINSTVSLDSIRTTFAIDGVDVDVNHSANYFEFESAVPEVAIVEDGEIIVVGEGSTLINATMAGIDVDGFAVLTGFVPPAAVAPAPTLPAQDVISMFGSKYANVPVDSWNTHWTYSTTNDADYLVAGHSTKMYSSLNFVGIEFLSQTIDASAMTHFHLDVFAPEGTDFKVKLVAFNGDNGLVIGQSELTFDDTTTPAFSSGDWVSLDIPLEDFGFTAPLDHMGQLVLSTSDATLVLVDNIYWHQ